DEGSDKFRFDVYGYGHGVGLSQHGANIMAQEGYSYKEILQHYYTGIEIK
ncbi:MAG: SpoIID/LytB domain protein, partial [Oscillospiraceae bacterium]